MTIRSVGAERLCALDICDNGAHFKHRLDTHAKSAQRHDRRHHVYSRRASFGQRHYTIKEIRFKYLIEMKRGAKIII